VKNVCRYIALAAALLFVQGVHAQQDVSTLTGTVMDPSNASVSSAVVEIKELDTGAIRSTKTNTNGSYYAGNLAIGTYRLTIQSPQFQTVQVEDIQLVVGQTRTLNIKLQVASVSEEVRVEDRAPPLSQTGAEIGGVVLNQQVKNLPLNGRNFASLMALVPGAIDSGGATVNSIRFAGRANDDNNFRLDGVDATGISHQGTNANLRLQISTESIAEFKVATLLYSAETGGAPGGQVEIVSKSGTNAFHGGVFDFLRNDFFDSKGPFDKKVPNLRLNDFGASVGGPILKNRTFFFVSYEGLRQKIAQTLVANVPSDAFRTAVVATSPVLAPFINAYPIGNGQAQGADVVQYISSTGTQNTEDSTLFRVDHRFNDANSISVRYNIDQANITAPSGSLRDQSVTSTSPMNAAVQYVHLFSPTMLNDLSLGFNRLASTSQTNSYLSKTQNINYTLSVSGLSNLSRASQSVQAPSTYSLLDNFTKTMGRHTFKAGVELKEVHYNYSQAGAQTLKYLNFSDFQNNLLGSVSIVAEVPMHGLHKLEDFGYVEDQFKMRPNLTLTGGLRYEFLNRLHEVHGRSRAFDPATCGGNCPQGAEFTYPVYNNIEPRFSLAWEPTRLGGKTVIRAGAGIYHGEGQIGDLNAPSDNFTTLFGLLPADFPGLSWPVQSFVDQAAQNPQAVQPRGLQRDRQDAKVTQWGLQIQTALPAGFILDSGYVGSHGDHLFTRSYVNNYIDGTKTRPLPGFGQVDYKAANGNSNFDGWQTSLQRQFRAGFSFQLNYLWSHSLNDGSIGGGEADYPNNVACFACEYANSDQDVTHTISANTIYELPFGKGKRYLTHGALGTLLGGISLNSIVTSRSGLPVNVVLSRPASAIPDGNNTEHDAGSPNLRPDLVPGVSLTPPAGSTIAQWINPAAFAVPANGTWGNSPRNLLRGPKLWQADLGMAKNFPVRERISMDFRAEIFNIFNRAQYGNPSGNFTACANTPSACSSFGNITSVVNSGATGSGTPRRMQFGLRINF
jgi:hypothetical protein